MSQLSSSYVFKQVTLDAQQMYINLNCPNLAAYLHIQTGVCWPVEHNTGGGGSATVP